MGRFRLWRRELLRAILITVAAAIVGSIFSASLEGALFGLVLVLLVWAVHLYRIQAWLLSPNIDPPEGWGIWGHLSDNIYALQRRNREAQWRLESALDYLQDSLASMRDGWMIIDPRGNIAWSNHSARGLLGVRFPEDRGQPLVNLVRNPQFTEYFSEGDYQQPLRIDQGGDVETRLQFEISLFGLGDRLVLVRDVTDQYNLEVMRRDFVGNVSHELRTPLTVIKGYIDNLEAMPLNDAEILRRPLSQMATQTVRMENLIKDLLWLSRIESFEGQVKSNQVDMVALIDEVVDGIKSAFPGQGIETSIQTSESILGDREELLSALSNLVVNACKYGASQRAIAVKWTSEEDSLVFSVQDFGSGIDAALIPRLTERFFRVEKSRAQQTGGTGLGLAIVKHVALSHQADLSITSELGRGSTFSLRFHKAPGINS